MASTATDANILRCELAEVSRLIRTLYQVAEVADGLATVRFTTREWQTIHMALISHAAELERRFCAASVANLE